MKCLGDVGNIVTKAGIPVDQALRYVFSLPISTLVSGMDSEKILDQNLALIRDHTPMSDDARHDLEQRHITVAGDGRYELFKSSKMFDGPVHRKQRGFDTMNA